MSQTASQGNLVVGHVVYNLDVGGLERVVIDLIRCLQSSGVENRVYCLEHPGAMHGLLAQSNVELEALYRKPGFSVTLAFKIASRLRRDRVDIVHAHNYGPLLYGGLAARIARTRGVVYTIHGVDAFRRNNPSKLRRARLIDRTIAVSREANDVAISEGGFAPHEVTLISNGVTMDDFSNGGDKAARLEELGLPARARVFGIVARLTPVKDHRSLFAAFEQIAAQDDTLHLLVVGDGETEDDLMRYRASLAHGERIHMLGQRFDIAELLSAMDVFVLSSYTEGLPVTLVEAAAAALPIVACQVGGCPEVVIDGKTGVLVPARDSTRLAEAMLTVVNSPDRMEMGRRGREHVQQRFSADTMAANYRSIYDELMNR